MKSVLPLLVLSFSTFSYGTVLVSGLYDGPQNANSNCSIHASYDDVRKQLSLARVNKYDGTFCDTQASDSENCIEKDGTVVCEGRSFKALIHNSKALTVYSRKSTHLSFGAIDWVADSASDATKYRSVNSVGWQWLQNPGRCGNIPPYSTEMSCVNLPVPLLESLCPDLKEMAETRALNLCSRESGRECKLNSSKYRIFKNRNAGTYIPKTESGCEWISISAPL